MIVARKVCVSAMTVSRVINRKRDIKSGIQQCQIEL